MNEEMVVCSKCYGTGLGEFLNQYDDKSIFLACTKCHGEGCITWVEEIFGRIFDIHDLNQHMAISVYKKDNLKDEKCGSVK